MTPSDHLEFLHSLAHSRRPEDRAVWIRVAADYFAGAAAEDEEENAPWIEHLTACLSEAPVAERSALAARLMAGKSRVPRLWQTISSFGGQCTHDAWKNAPNLPHLGDHEILDAGIAIAVATRADLDEVWIAAILEIGDAEAMATLAANASASLLADHLLTLANLARRQIETAGDRRLALALLSREPVAVELASLFLEATPPVRQALLLAAQRAELARRRVGATASLSRETIARLEQYALEGENEEFTQLLARSIGASPALAARIVSDPDGEPLAVALSAIGAPNDVCVRILTAADFRTGGAYRRLNALARLRDILNPYAARRITVAIVGTGAAQSDNGAFAPPLAASNPRQTRAGFAPLEAAPAREQARIQPRKLNTFGAR